RSSPRRRRHDRTTARNRRPRSDARPVRRRRHRPRPTHHPHGRPGHLAAETEGRQVMTAVARDLPVFVGDFEPGSPEWHAARARGLGGSEIAAVLGLSPWESKFSLWHRKMGLASPVVETDEMYWGKLHEPTILAEWNRR